MPIHRNVARARALARPLPIRSTIRGRVRSTYARMSANIERWQVSYVAVLALLTWWMVSDPDASRLPLIAWVVGGVHSWFAGTWLTFDTRQRRDRHDRSGLPAIQGWRLASGHEEIEADQLLAIDLVAYLFDHAKLVHIPIRGRRHRMRTAYETSLRELARGSWARSRGVSGRRADRLLAEQLCRRHGLVRLVPIGNAMAYRLVDETIEAALCRLERSAGRPLIAWQLGRDPRFDKAAR